MARKHLKAFQDMCRRKVHDDMVNQPDGTWHKADPVGEQMDSDMQAGYRLAGRRRRAKKQKQSAA